MNYYIRILKSMLSIVVMFYAAQTTAATFTYGVGGLTGVNGVQALGETWNATFQAGSFDDVDSIYGLSPFLYTEDDSLALSVALAADMSILNGSLNPEDVNGCTALSGPCIIVTPHTFFTAVSDPVPDVWIQGLSVEISQSMTVSLTPDLFTGWRDFDFPNTTYAVWEVSAVPVPAAVWLFASGLLGLIGVARRKKA